MSFSSCNGFQRTGNINLWVPWPITDINRWAMVNRGLGNPPSARALTWVWGLDSAIRSNLFPITIILKSRCEKLSRIWSRIIRQYWNRQREGPCSYAGPKIAATELRILHTKNVSGLAISNTRTYAWTVRNPSGCPLFHSARLSTGKRRWKEMKLSSKSVGKHSIWLIAQQSVQKDVPAGEHRILSTLVRVSHKPNSSCRRPCVSFGCGWLGNHF